MMSATNLHSAIVATTIASCNYCMRVGTVHSFFYYRVIDSSVMN